MYLIGEISVEDSVLGTKFACDLDACKGACCTFPGGRGAPLLDSEVGEIQNAFPVIKNLLPPEHLAAIERQGLIDGSPGNYATPCVDGKACVFVYYDGDIAKCAFERRFHEKKLAWPKPESCHLFPIRRRNDGNAVHYEYFSECEPALAKGQKENISLPFFVAAPLERVFGEEWTRDLQNTITTNRP